MGWMVWAPEKRVDQWGITNRCSSGTRRCRVLQGDKKLRYIGYTDHTSLAMLTCMYLLYLYIYTMTVIGKE